ncbi:uncharacterized protein LOC130139675 [Syzygium oleosum]|uniref:uncharacterized protein LOC130139675 n=1 Tax=Syzygium oleosum TaxID=219896 RepID=UPI0024BB9E3A|nr:uncharacterized protein LOC130139675 [Syzygium oleosum]
MARSVAQIQPRGRLRLRRRLRSPHWRFVLCPSLSFTEKRLRLALYDEPRLCRRLPKPLWRALGGGAGAGGDGGVKVCAFDNRSTGRSSVPVDMSEYTTKIMAKDVIAVLNHLGWERAHVIGHSIGAMIACKLAAMVPNKVLSLGLLNVTSGGYECFPKLDRRTISIAIRFFRAKTPEQRAAVDLDTHCSKEYLEEYDGSSTRRGSTPPSMTLLLKYAMQGVWQRN